ncbi:MAG TPA: hypothetical protein VEP93_07725 [Variovorax sp.]|nr:hypothetical protein [Variovorax sp.]
MSELTVDFWMALSVIPMVIALGIYIWLSRRFDRTQEQEARRYEDLVQKVRAPLNGAAGDDTSHGNPPTAGHDDRG